MTYCVGIKLAKGLVFCSDSRTNAGVDQVSTYSKMRTFGSAGERQFVLLSAGNLATTQAVVEQLERDIRDNAEESLNSVTDVAAAARYLGRISVQQQAKCSGGVPGGFEATFLLGGQVVGSESMLVLIYPQGNYITTSRDTPYLQIGESKYGKPILDRIITRKTTLRTAAVCALVSMDSTMRSNITVGPPIELQVYKSDSFNLSPGLRLAEGSAYLRKLKKGWDDKIKKAFRKLADANPIDIDSREILTGSSKKLQPKPDPAKLSKSGKQRTVASAPAQVQAGTLAVTKKLAKKRKSVKATVA